MKNDLKFSGVIKKILPVETINARSGKTYLKQFFIVEENEGQFPSSALFEIFISDDKPNPLDGIGALSAVEVAYNCECSEYDYTNKQGIQTTGYNHRNRVWKINTLQVQAQIQPSAPSGTEFQQPEPHNSPAPVSGGDDGCDDLPF